MILPKVVNSHLYMKSDPIVYLLLSEAPIRFQNPLISNQMYVYLYVLVKVTSFNVISKPSAASTMPGTQQAFKIS